jgi:hypothetical protein
MSAIGRNLFFAPAIVGHPAGDFWSGRVQSLHRRPRREFYWLDSLDCADDAEAIEKTKRLVDGHDVELWSGPRLVILQSHKPE